MLRVSNLSKHFGEPPFFEKFDLLLTGDGCMVLKCCIHDFAEEVLKIKIVEITYNSKSAKGMSI